MKTLSSLFAGLALGMLVMYVVVDSGTVGGFPAILTIDLPQFSVWGMVVCVALSAVLLLADVIAQSVVASKKPQPCCCQCSDCQKKSALQDFKSQQNASQTVS